MQILLPNNEDLGNYIIIFTDCAINNIFNYRSRYS